MAVHIEFFNVIVRKTAVERCFPGGLDGFVRQDLPNFTEDEHIIRVGFMDLKEAHEFASELESEGLRAFGLESDSDIAVVGGSFCELGPWLSGGTVNGISACWATDQPIGELIVFDPGFVLRCPASVGNCLAEVVRQCGAKIREVVTGEETGILAKLCCVRDDAKLDVYVFGDNGGSPVGLWGCRQIKRRKQFHADVALIHDLVAVLLEAGAKNE